MTSKKCPLLFEERARERFWLEQELEFLLVDGSGNPIPEPTQKNGFRIECGMTEFW
jgi:hypothetical protein